MPEAPIAACIRLVHLKIIICLETIIVTLSRPFWLSIQDISINEVVFFAKSLIKNQIRLFRLYPTFRLFQTFRLSDSTALVSSQHINAWSLEIFNERYLKGISLSATPCSVIILESVDFGESSLPTSSSSGVMMLMMMIIVICLIYSLPSGKKDPLKTIMLIMIVRIFIIIRTKGWWFLTAWRARQQGSLKDTPVSLFFFVWGGSRISGKTIMLFHYIGKLLGSNRVGVGIE